MDTLVLQAVFIIFFFSTIKWSLPFFNMSPFKGNAFIYFFEVLYSEGEAWPQAMCTALLTNTRRYFILLEIIPLLPRMLEANLRLT